MKRRSVLAGLASMFLSGVARAQRFWIGQVSTGGSFTLPAGVTLVNNDGNTGVALGNPGALYYTTKLFTNAATAGFDDTLFPIIAWWPGIGGSPSGPQRVKNFNDVGVNVLSWLSPPTGSGGSNDPLTLTYLGPAGAASLSLSAPVYLIQGVFITSPNNGWVGWMTGSGAETVGFLTVDEPGYWNFATDPGFEDVVNSSAGTWLNSIAIPAHWQDNKFQWINWQGQFMVSPTNNYPAVHFPALAASANNFFTAGANFGTGGFMTPSEMLYTQVANRDGNLRRLDMTGADIYWFSTQPSSDLIDGIAAGLSASMGIWDLGLGGITVSGTFTANVGTVIGTFSVPAGTFATSLIEAHASDPNHQALARTDASRSATISNATWAATSGGQATFTTMAAHGFVVGQTNILVSGVTPSGYNNGSFPYYTALAGTTGSTLIVALASNPGAYSSGGTALATASMLSPVTAWTPGSPGSMTLGASTVVKNDTSLNGSFNNWSVGTFTMSPDQQFRGPHYGGMIDAFRSYQNSSVNNIRTPLIGSVENNDQGAPGWRFPTPPQMNAATWGNIIHGARGFYTINGDTVNTPGGPAYSIQAGNKVSIYDRMKSTHLLVNTLARVINSPFAEGTLAAGYVHVTGDNAGGSTAGFRAPWRGSDFGITPNPANSYTYTGGVGTNTNNFNRSLASAFEVMAKFYQGTTIPAVSNNGVALTHNQFWLFCDYRGSGQDGVNGAAATTLNATFTIANTGSTNVDRFYSDSVLGSASSTGGTRTTITCGETQQIAVGDTVIIFGTSNLNGTYSVTATNGTGPNGVRTTFDINFPFPGALTPGSNGTGNGAFISIHNIPVTGGGTTFTDSFPQGTCIGIYRVN